MILKDYLNLEEGILRNEILRTAGRKLETVRYDGQGRMRERLNDLFQRQKSDLNRKQDSPLAISRGA